MGSPPYLSKQRDHVGQAFRPDERFASGRKAWPTTYPSLRHTVVSTQLRLDDVRRAWESSDPELSRLVVELAEQPDEKPETPPREGAPTFAKFVAELHSQAFAR